MIIEVLFPKLCNLYGDVKNMDYFQKCLPDATFIRTEITEERPYFADHEVDMVYMGSMSEKVMGRVADYLRPYLPKINEMISANKIFLLTGNAMEVFTEKIENITSKETVQGLALIPLQTKIDFYDRYNGKDMGQLEDFSMVGFRSQFSMVYGENKEPFLTVDKGIGINKNTNLEGFRRNNFIATQMIGPILLLNPYFTEYLMKLLGIENPVCAFREASIDAYEQRLKEFKNPNTPVGN